MEHKCPHCGAPLRSESSFCPHCATDIHPRKQAKTATPLLKKLLLGLLALAVLAAVGLGLWLAFAPKTYDGYGEVHYGDWQLLLTQHTDRYTPVPEMTISGEPEGQYRMPALRGKRIHRIADYPIVFISGEQGCPHEIHNDPSLTVGSPPDCP